MALNGTTILADLIPEVWSSTMYDELRSQILFANVFERKYEGEIRAFGDTVKVNQIAAATGEILTDDTASFTPEAMTITQNSIVVNKRASASFEVSDLAQLQSLDFQNEAQQALVYGIQKQLEDDLIAALAAGVSVAAPDHDIAPATAGQLAGIDLATMRTLLSAAKVPKPGRVFLADPQYYGDLLNDSNVMSRDFTSGNQSEPGVADKFMGFQIIEHDGLGADKGYAVHPSALQLVMQQGIRVKVSDLHSNKQYGYLVSADMVYGYSIFDDNRFVQISG